MKTGGVYLKMVSDTIILFTFQSRKYGPLARNGHSPSARGRVNDRFLSNSISPLDSISLSPPHVSTRDFAYQLFHDTESLPVYATACNDHHCPHNVPRISVQH